MFFSKRPRAPDRNVSPVKARIALAIGALMLAVFLFWGMSGCGGGGRAPVKNRLAPTDSSSPSDLPDGTSSGNPTQVQVIRRFSATRGNLTSRGKTLWKTL